MDNNENKRFEDYSDPRVTNLNGQPYHSASENDGKPFSERGYESAANQGYGGANYNYGRGVMLTRMDMPVRIAMPNKMDIPITMAMHSAEMFRWIRREDRCRTVMD